MIHAFHERSLDGCPSIRVNLPHTNTPSERPSFDPKSLKKIDGLYSAENLENRLKYLDSIRNKIPSVVAQL